VIGILKSFDREFISTFIDDPYSLNLDKITRLFTNLKPGVYQAYIFFYPRP